MDRALDDLVSNRRQGFRRGGGGGPQRRRGGGGGYSFGHDDRGSISYGHDDRVGVSYDRDDNRSGGGAFRRTRVVNRNNTPYGRSEGSVDSVWKHDRFDENEEDEEMEDIIEEPSQGGFGGRRAGGRGIETGTRLQITNLAFSVASEDLKDLFEAVGDIKRATVNFDKSGRSLGTATVVFSRRNDALAAIKEYNGVALDDLPMKISIVGTNVGATRNFNNNNNNNNDDDYYEEDGGGSSSRFQRAGGFTVSLGGGGGGGRGGGRRIVAGGGGGPRRITMRSVGVRGSGRGGRGGRGRGGRGGGGGFSRGGDRSKLTAEQLDAEMDAYNEQE